MISTGDSLPNIDLTKATAEGPQPIKSADYFGGKKTILFAVPGAFTPTCSARHLPGFVEKAGELKSKGVDQIACTAVNDAFVLKAWAESAGSDGVVDMLADGNADFAKAVGLSLDASGFGMGIRSQRYAMIVEDNKVTRLFVEDPGAFEVSSADYVLGQL